MLRPFFTYMGGKYRLAPRYPKPRYQTIVEPFAGSAGYSVRYYRHNVRLYDIDSQVIGVWQYLIKATPEEIIQLPLQFEDVRDLDICQEAQWLISSWLFRGTGFHNYLFNPERAARGASGSNYWGEPIRNRIAKQVSFIKHWKATVRSYRNVPDHRATWFIDPPYQVHGVNYKHGSTKIDYGYLQQWVQRRWGQVIVCGEATCDYLPFQMFYRQQSSKPAMMVGRLENDEMIYTCHNE